MPRTKGRGVSYGKIVRGLILIGNDVPELNGKIVGSLRKITYPSLEQYIT